MSVAEKQYFCSGCGAMRQQGAKRCVSCGRKFDDESNASETAYALSHPEVKKSYQPKGTLGRFFERMFTFHYVMAYVGIIMILIAVGALLPYIVGKSTQGLITHLEAINCRKDCQYIVDYQFTDNTGRLRTGQYHWSYKDYYFYPPEEGQPTTVKYVPFLRFIPPISTQQWFPWGMFILIGVGILDLVAIKRDWI